MTVAEIKAMEGLSPKIREILVDLVERIEVLETP